jgi:hypothetical protein
MTGLIKRDIPVAPGYQIDRDGNVSVDTVRLPTLTITGKSGLKCLAVEISGNKIEVWKLIQIVWHPKKYVFTRTGDLLNLRRENVFVLEKMEFKNRFSDQTDIQKVWYAYTMEQKPVSLLRDHTGMTAFDEEDYMALIKSLTLAAIRR